MVHEKRFCLSRVDAPAQYWDGIAVRLKPHLQEVRTEQVQGSTRTDHPEEPRSFHHLTALRGSLLWRNMPQESSVLPALPQHSFQPSFSWILYSMTERTELKETPLGHLHLRIQWTFWVGKVCQQPLNVVSVSTEAGLHTEKAHELPPPSHTLQLHHICYYLYHQCHSEAFP